MIWIGAALVCLGAIVTVAGWTMAWVTHARMERRLVKLEMDLRQAAWPPGVDVAKRLGEVASGVGSKAP